MAKRTVMRGESVVNGVLAAAVQELARAGYRGLRIEDVALRAGVNKTTIYRRWPTKVELVRAALASNAHRFVLPQTGGLRSDLLAVGRNFVELAGSPEGQSVIRMLVAEGSDPEVADLERLMRATFDAMPKTVLANAVARGELAPDVDHMVVFDAFIGAIHHRIFMMNEPVTEEFLARLVDVILLGALLPSPRRPRRANASSR
jgi:AcrR family transcriptional regulator